jgi:hypothetical protein
MQRPQRIAQTWKEKCYDSENKKWEYTPIVTSRCSEFVIMKSVSRKIWFSYIKLGFMTINKQLREWLDENGYSDVKDESKPCT